MYKITKIVSILGLIIVSISGIVGVLNSEEVFRVHVIVMLLLIFNEVAIENDNIRS